MNLLEYRELKAQEEAEKNAMPEGSESHAQTQQVPATPVEHGVQTPPQEEPTPNQGGAEEGAQVEPAKAEDKPQVFEIDGNQVSLEELQRGYLRQSDYTRKTQELARKERELSEALQLREQMESNPELAQAVGYDPKEAHYRQLEAEYYDLRLQQEVSQLSSKYADFEVSDVLDFALNRNINNLEDAYLLHKQYRSSQTQAPENKPQSIDVESLKRQIREELLAEQGTGTIISSSGRAPEVKTTPELSAKEQEIARNLGLTNEEYIKYR